MSQISKELEYHSQIRDVKAAQLSVLSPEELTNRSVVKVTETILYDSSGEPIVGGLFDPRMGVIDHGKICPTDGLDNRYCPGYFGHIKLGKPVYHYQFFDISLNIYKCICKTCSKLLVDINDPEIKSNLDKLDNKKKMAYIVDLSSKIKVCGGHGNDENGCGAVQPTKTMKDPKKLCKIFCEYSEAHMPDTPIEERRISIPAENMLKMFKRITDEECLAIGLNPNWCRPEWLICTVVPVPPPTVRPSVRQANGTRSEDDLTHKLIDILKTNNQLIKKLEAENSKEVTIDEWTNVLQYHVATLVDNEIQNVNPSCHRSGRPLKTLRERLKGKEGRIRGNLMGKRVDHCARSVITPDPNIKINELGVPLKVALNLTFPEVVNQYNIGRLYSYVRNGPFKHPGAKSIKRKIDQGTTSLLHVDTSTITLNEGDIVNRHLIDGDTVLFNRQPSLHKLSMMAHTVKVMPYDTFRLNVSVTTPYNADFDGDEMNMHVPQSLQTSCELKYIAAVPNHIISPREHSPIITPIQDTLLGVNRVTKDNVLFNRNEMMNILMYIKDFNGILPEPSQSKPMRWNGRQLVSIIIPNGININMKNNSFDEDKPGGDKLNHVIIKNGELIQGCIDKKIMSSGSRGLIHIIYNDYGIEECQKFLDNLQNLITRYLVKTAFSVGISDLIANKETNTLIEKTILNKKKEVSKLAQQLHNQTFDKGGSDNVNENFEKNINRILNKALADAGKIGLKALSSNNRMTNMVSAGSKGKSINIAQMVACLGQQNVDGKRIPNGFNDRTLPHFTKYDISPESKGFVENSFIRGLTPQEFFFHAMGGREGLIDTAVKTSETGYIQRKLIKSMEDSKVSFDLSVRNANGNIIQYMYGEDGINSIKIENQPFSYLKDDYETIKEKFRFDFNEKWNSFMLNDSVKKMKSNDGYKDVLETHFKQIVEDYTKVRSDIFKYNKDTTIKAPININRLIQNASKMFQISGSNVSNLNPIDVIKDTEELLESLTLNKFESCSKLYKMLIRSYLSPKQLIKYNRLNKIAFDYIKTTIKTKFQESKIQPNEMVGPVAAQSIGEPATQMTLNTFHFAGVASKSNVTRGVPRLKELLHLSKKIKAPSLNIYLKPDMSQDKTKAKSILNQIELTKLDEIISSVKVYYDPDDNNTHIQEDKPLIQLYNLFSKIDNEIENEDDCKSKYIIRFEFDKETLMNKDITMEMVYYKMKLAYSEQLSCVYSDDNSSKLVFRIRLLKTKKLDYNKINDLNFIKSLIKSMREKLIIKGKKNIKGVTMYKNKTKFVQEGNDYDTQEEWILDTDGINMLEIMAMDNIDKARLESNDIYETYNLLGIEAARSTIMNEMNEVIEGAGSYVNYRHMSLLVDVMTNRGSLMSIDRFGINRGNIGPLAKCSFEETTDQLFKAAIFGEVDNLNGVSANIMMGQIPPCGTGATEYLLDESKLTQMVPEAEVEVGDIETWEEKATYCDENIGIDFDIDEIEPNQMI